MTDSKVPEETAGGPLGKLAGKAKERPGRCSATKNLPAKGGCNRPRQTPRPRRRRPMRRHGSARPKPRSRPPAANNELERERLKTELAAEEREAAIDRDRARSC